MTLSIPNINFFQMHLWMSSLNAVASLTRNSNFWHSDPSHFANTLVFTARCILKWETMRLMLIKDVISNQQQLNVFMHTCKKSNVKNIINIFHVLSNANALLNSCYLQKSRNWKDKRRHIITSRRLTHWQYWKKESKNVFILICCD